MVRIEHRLETYALLYSIGFQPVLIWAVPSVARSAKKLSPGFTLGDFPARVSPEWQPAREIGARYDSCR